MPEHWIQHRVICIVLHSQCSTSDPGSSEVHMRWMTIASVFPRGCQNYIWCFSQAFILFLAGKYQEIPCLFVQHSITNDWDKRKMDDSLCSVQVKDAALAVEPHLVAMACGSYRRGKATCGDVDVLISHPDGKSHKGVFTKVLQSLHDSGEPLFFSFRMEFICFSPVLTSLLFVSQVFWRMTWWATRRMESRRSTWACAGCRGPATAIAGWMSSWCHTTSSPVPSCILPARHTSTAQWEPWQRRKIWVYQSTRWIRMWYGRVVWRCLAEFR